MFTGLALSIGIEAAATRAEPADAWISYVREQAVPLADPADVDRLLPVLADRALVLLGETTHGTHDYYVWRAELSKALIAKAGFRFIAVEGDWSAIDRLDRYVRHLDPDASSARAVLETFDRWAEWMWANPVIEELAEWMRDFNAARDAAERVGIHGIDVYGWGDSVSRLPGILDALDPGWGERAGDGLAPLLRIDGDPQLFYRAVLSGQPTGAAKLDRISQRLETESTTFRGVDPEAWMQARQQTALVQQAKRHLRKNSQRHPRSWNPRAENFMQTVDRLRVYYGPDRHGIVWAHNTHIGDARYTPMRHSGLVTIGQRAREGLGDDNVFLLGFASDRGTFRAGRRWGERGDVIALPTAQPETLDAFLRDARPEQAAFFIALAAARDNALLTRPTGHRAIGVVHAAGARMEHSYVPSIVPLRYDGLLFIRDTTALDYLD